MRIRDWSSDVFSSELEYRQHAPDGQRKGGQQDQAAVGDGGADDRGDHGVGPASSVPASSAYFGTSCMSMNGDLPGLSKCLSGRIGSYQYRTSRSPCGSASAAPSMSGKIGRASCRERVCQYV